MAFSCLTHIFTISSTAIPEPAHIGVIHRAPLTQNLSSTFSQTSNVSTTAFAPSLATGTAHRKHSAFPIQPRAKTMEIEGEIGDSWVPEAESRHGDGWHVGYERATQMTVKRKGRGAFMFEGAMMEEWGVEKKEGNEDEEGEEGIYGVGKLEDGFEYRGWVDEEMAIASTKGVEGDVVGRVNVFKDEEEIEIESRNAMEGNRNSVGRAIFWGRF